MDKKEIRAKLQELADENTSKGDYRTGYLQALNDANDVVKLFAIPCVTQRSELLIAFHEFLLKQPLQGMNNTKLLVDMFKSNL